MSEIKVNAFGLVKFTRRQYLITQGIVFAILIAVIVVAYVNDYSSSENVLLRYLGVGSVIIMVLELAETFFMLKKFSEKVRESESDGEHKA